MTNNMSFFSPCFFKVDSLNFVIFFFGCSLSPTTHKLSSSYWLIICMCMCVCRIWWFIFNTNTEKERKIEKKRKPNPIFIHRYEFCSRFFTPIKKNNWKTKNVVKLNQTVNPWDPEICSIFIIIILARSLSLHSHIQVLLRYYHPESHSKWNIDWANEWIFFRFIHGTKWQIIQTRETKIALKQGTK